MSRDDDAKAGAMSLMFNRGVSMVKTSIIFSMRCWVLILYSGKGLKGWIKEHDALSAYRAEVCLSLFGHAAGALGVRLIMPLRVAPMIFAGSMQVQERAQQYIPITEQDLIATGTTDYEAASRVFGKSKDPKLGLAVIKFQSFVAQNLTTIPLELRSAPRIQALHMGYNQLPRIDSTFFRMPVLKELNLDQNELEEIPAEFRYLTVLEVLSIKNNRLKHINYHFCTLTNLRELALSHNELTKLPSFFGNFCNLSHLWLSNNQIKELPVDERVKLLEFDPNTGERYVRDSPGVGGLVSLEELWLDNNAVTTITGEIGRCKSLKYLNLRRNQLSELPAETAQLKNLQHVVLTHNAMTDIPIQLVSVPKLHTLQLENNRIERISDAIVEATALTELNVACNPLVSVPSVISTMPHLITFNATNAVHDKRGVVISASWSRQHAHADSFLKIVQEQSASVSIPNRVFVYRSKNLPRTACSRLYNEYYQSHASPFFDPPGSAATSRPSSSAWIREGGSEGSHPPSSRGSVAGSDSGARGGMRATLTSAGSSRGASRGGFRGASTAGGDGSGPGVLPRQVSAGNSRQGGDSRQAGDDGIMSRGVSAYSGRTAGSAGRQNWGNPDVPADVLRPKKDRTSIGPVSGEVLMPGEKLEEHQGQTKLLMLAVSGVRFSVCYAPV